MYKWNREYICGHCDVEFNADEDSLILSIVEELPEKQFIVICPGCGHAAVVPKNIIPQSVKWAVERK